MSQATAANTDEIEAEQRAQLSLEAFCIRACAEVWLTEKVDFVGIEPQTSAGQGTGCYTPSRCHFLSYSGSILRV